MCLNVLLIYMLCMCLCNCMCFYIRYVYEMYCLCIFMRFVYSLCVLYVFLMRFARVVYILVRCMLCIVYDCLCCVCVIFVCLYIFMNFYVSYAFFMYNVCMCVCNLMCFYPLYEYLMCFHVALCVLNVFCMYNVRIRLCRYMCLLMYPLCPICVFYVALCV